MTAPWLWGFPPGPSSRPVTVGGEGLLDGDAQWGGRHAQPGGEGGAVDDERLLELVLHLEDLADRRVRDGESAQQQRVDLAKAGSRLPCHPEGLVDQLTRGARARVVREVPGPPR